MSIWRSIQLVSFRFDLFRFVSICFVSFRSVSFRFVSFRSVSFLFRFALYRDLKNIVRGGPHAKYRALLNIDKMPICSLNKKIIQFPNHDMLVTCQTKEE